MNQLERRVIELSYKYKLTHIGSCLNAVNVINEVYEQKEERDPFVLGAGHASLALYVVLEAFGHCNAEAMIKEHGTHSKRDMAHGIWCSNGSLGMAETVALGLAMADLTRTVWLVTSDGSCMEGSVYEAMRIAHKHTPNLVCLVIFNGTGAYGEIQREDLPTHHIRVQRAGDQLPEFLQGVKGHYLQLNQAQYEELMA